LQKLRAPALEDEISFETPEPFIEVVNPFMQPLWLGSWGKAVQVNRVLMFFKKPHLNEIQLNKQLSQDLLSERTNIMATPTIYLPSTVLTQAAIAGHERIQNMHWLSELDRQDSVVASSINVGNIWRW
jgi:hypothetical protein